jgi:hypothetical protein
MTGLALGIMRPSAAAMLAGGAPLLPSLDLDFARSVYKGAALSDLSVTRASSGMAQKADGSWVSFGPNAPRITDKGLLVEEARTNLVVNTEVALGVNTPGLTHANVGSGTEDGIAYQEYVINGTASSNWFALHIQPTNVPIAGAAAYTCSMFVRHVSGGLFNTTNKLTDARFHVRQNNGLGDVTGLALSGGAQLSADRLGKCRLVSPAITTSAGATQAFAFLQFNFPAGTVFADFRIRIGLPQLEQGSFATSPIRTTGAAATRAADFINLVANSWLKQGEGSLFAEYVYGPKTGNMTWARLDSGNEESTLGIRETSASVPQVELKSGGNNQANFLFNDAAAESVDTIRRLGVAYASNDVCAACDGVSRSPDTSAVIPTFTTLRFGTHSSGGDYPNSYIRRVAYFPSRLPNAQLQALTA